MALTYLDSPALVPAADAREARTGSGEDAKSLVDDLDFVLGPSAYTFNALPVTSASEEEEDVIEEGTAAMAPMSLAGSPPSSIFSYFAEQKPCDRTGARELLLSVVCSSPLLAPSGPGAGSTPIGFLSPKLLPLMSPLALGDVKTTLGFLSPLPSATGHGTAWSFPSSFAAAPAPASPASPSDSTYSCSAKCQTDSPGSSDRDRDAINSAAEEEEEEVPRAQKRRRTEAGRRITRSSTEVRTSYRRKRRVRDEDDDWVASESEDDEPAPPRRVGVAAPSTAVEAAVATLPAPATLVPNSEISVLSISAARSVLSAAALAKLKAHFKKGWVPGSLAPSDGETAKSLREKPLPPLITLAVPTGPAPAATVATEASVAAAQPSDAHAPATAEASDAATVRAVPPQLAALALPLPAPEFTKKSNRGGRRGRRENPLFGRPPRRARGELKAEKERRAKEREAKRREKEERKQKKQAAAASVTPMTPASTAAPASATKAPLPSPVQAFAGPTGAALPLPFPLGFPGLQLPAQVSALGLAPSLQFAALFAQAHAIASAAAAAKPAG